MDESTPKYLLVEKHIKKSIKNKSIVDKLPGERTLASDLGFSYMTIRKAVDNLVNEGILYKVPTKGTFVANTKKGKKKTRNIGYFLDSNIVSGISSPYYSLIFHALEKQAARNGYSVIYISDIGEDRIENLMSKLDGVIASCFPRIEQVIQEINQTIPVVVIDNSAADKTIPSVIIDNFNAVSDSVNFMCSLNHSHIGFMNGLDDSDVGKNRYAGFKHGLSINEFDFDESQVYLGNYSFEAGLDGAEYFLSQRRPPTAIICANDSMALGAMGKLNQRGFRVPQDISVMGFDDIEVASQIVPALTTVSAPVKEIAERSFDMLHHLIKGEPLDNKHVALPASLAIRRSCAEPNAKIAAA
jgi:DNA-binding LacI/PurR family transcriptional regulator